MNKDIQAIKDESLALLPDTSKPILVATEADYALEGDRIKVLKAYVKTVDDKRLTWTRPMDDAKKLIMADIRTITDPLNDYVDNSKKAMSTWFTTNQAKLDAEQAVIDAKAVKGSTEAIIEVPVVNETMTIKGETATITVKQKMKWRITDETLIQREYLHVNSALIDEKIKDTLIAEDGSCHIKGIEVYYEYQDPSVR